MLANCYQSVIKSRRGCYQRDRLLDAADLGYLRRLLFLDPPLGSPPGLPPLGSTSGLPPQGSPPLGSAPWVSLLGPPPGPPRGTPPPGCFRWVHSLGPVSGSPSWDPQCVYPPLFAPPDSPPRFPPGSSSWVPHPLWVPALSSLPEGPLPVIIICYYYIIHYLLLFNSFHAICVEMSSQKKQPPSVLLTVARRGRN